MPKISELPATMGELVATRESRIVGPSADARPVPAAPGPSATAGPSEKSPTVAFRKDIHGMRAVAVALVVLCHAHVPGFSGGFVGVDIFFVISGFVITGVLVRDNGFDPRKMLARFYARRARRILPAAGLVTVLTVAATYGALGFVRGFATGRDAVSVAFFVSNYHFIAIGTDYAQARMPASPLQNYWSLAVEEQFYLVYPALCLLALRFGRRRFTPALAGMMAAVIICSYGWSVHLTSANATAAYFSSAARACELGVGCLTFLLGPKLRSLLSDKWTAPLGWLGMTLIAWAAVQFDASTPYPGTLVALPTIGSALLIASGASPSRRTPGVLLGNRGFQWIGSMSYSIYLIHWPVFTIAEQYWATPLTAPVRTGLVGATLLLALVSYVSVEKPIWKSRYLSTRPLLSLCIFPVFVVTILAVVIAEQACVGLPLRLF
ncbi:acyltransferase [Mycolicibacterium sp. lyk4-40-TYG-92]|uniref:acyltransferase family protein n=1 Tax=Mycolicibacterium sp. lyk4-40-TYG-92 TaxID=3040295 RepID=UPI00254D504C|nr:acyltransferase [Mycolicibacterium sp. lyk4-40-TYG-92]